MQLRTVHITGRFFCYPRQRRFGVRYWGNIYNLQRICRAVRHSLITKEARSHFHFGLYALSARQRENRRSAHLCQQSALPELYNEKCLYLYFLNQLQNRTVRFQWLAADSLPVFNVTGIPIQQLTAYLAELWRSRADDREPITAADSLPVFRVQAGLCRSRADDRDSITAADS